MKAIAFIGWDDEMADHFAALVESIAVNDGIPGVARYNYRVPLLSAAKDLFCCRTREAREKEFDVQIESLFDNAYGEGFFLDILLERRAKDCLAVLHGLTPAAKLEVVQRPDIDTYYLRPAQLSMLSGAPGDLDGAESIDYNGKTALEECLQILRRYRAFRFVG